MSEAGARGIRIEPDLVSGSERHNVTPPPDAVKSEATAPALEAFHWARWRIGDLDVTYAPAGSVVPGDGPVSRDGARVYPSTPGSGSLGEMWVRRAAPRPRERWWLHALLLALTLFTTTIGGALLSGWAPPARELRLGPLAIAVPAAVRLADLLPGLWFSVPLCAILLAHELGHYLMARAHRMDVSPPYFIPAPYMLSLAGTFGAFIRLRSALVNRLVLLDVGAAGPLAGMVLALPITALGLLWSEPVPGAPLGAAMRWVVQIGPADALPLGGSLLFEGLTRLMVAPHGMVRLHPLAVAGWLGLFVTALNLLPAGQLDGGHVLYALLGRAQRWIALGAVVALALLGFLWAGWWTWAVLILVLGRGRIEHPAVFDARYELHGTRRVVAWACIVLFLATFTPRPFYEVLGSLVLSASWCGVRLGVAASARASEGDL